MMPNDSEKLNRVEELKRKLFSNNYQTKIEYRDSFAHHNEEKVPETFEAEDQGVKEDESFKKTTMFKKFFIFSVVFFVLALGYVSYMFFAGNNSISNENIEISILGNTFTAGGEELPLQIEIINKNSSALELVDLVLEYPKGSGGNTAKDMERKRISLGTIPSGGVKNENTKIVLFGEQGSVQNVKISIEYRVGGSNAIFVKEKSYDVSINSTPINISVDAPTEVSPNQDITLNIKSTLNASKPASKILIKVEYPVGFVFGSSKPAPTLGNNVWNLGDLSPGAESNIAITGKMIDVFDGEEKSFRIFSGSQSEVDKSAIAVVFNSLGHTVLIKKPFIEAKLFVNGSYDREYAVGSKSPISGNIRWVNNLDTKINDLEIRVKLSGNALDRNNIDAPGGFYNSSEDTIIWNKNSQSSFGEVNPGKNDSVSFSLETLPVFSAGGGMLSEPSVNIEVSISGKQAAEGNVLQTIKNSESKKIRIITDVGLAAKALYYSGLFENTGPIPPKAEKETTYTVVWSLSNTSNNVSKAQVKATLPPWVRFVGAVSPLNENVLYNITTKEITWNVGSIPRGTSITQTGREVSFQIAFIPSLSQVDTTPTVINDAVLTGHDDFANVEVRVNKASLNTRISGDPTFPSSGARVVK